MISEEEFNSLALELFSLQFQHNLPYRKFCEARRSLPSIARCWKDIPAIPTTAFKELDLTCLPPEERTIVFHSSGTTGHRPSRHFHNRESLKAYEDSCWQWFSHSFLSEEDEPPELLVLTPRQRQAPDSSLVHMFETIRLKTNANHSCFVGNVERDGAWTIDFETALSELLTPDPMFVLGTAFSFVHLLDYIEEDNVPLKLPPGSRVIETGGYKGRSRSMPKHELHELITKCLGVSGENIICEYGMSELSSQAYNTTSSHHFQFPPWARAQIISPETGKEVSPGETGLIRVFDLANVYSVMAIQTEDLAIRHEEGFELIGRAQLAEPRGCSLMAQTD